MTERDGENTVADVPAQLDGQGALAHGIATDAVPVAAGTPNDGHDLHTDGHNGHKGRKTDGRGRAANRPALPVVAGDGIQIESDGGVRCMDGTLRLLSVWGAAKTARYLAAQLATGKRLDVQTEPLGPWGALWGGKDASYKRLRRSVSARLSHTLVIGRACDATRLDGEERTFVVTLRRDRPEQAETIYTAFLIALLDEPLDPSWAGWLWRRARAKGEARPLVVWGPVLREAWECDLPATLRTDISAARAGDSSYGELPVPRAERAA